MKKDKQTRFVLSGGWAFAEESDMNKLSARSAQGWFLERNTLFGYVVRKGTPHKQIYCMDIRDLPKEEEKEYHDIFTDSGWTYVCSAGDFHFFSAEPGTVPIHTDRTTIYEKYTKITRIFRNLAFTMTLLHGLSACYNGVYCLFLTCNEVLTINVLLNPCSYNLYYRNYGKKPAQGPAPQIQY